MTQKVVPFLHTPLTAPELLELMRETLRQGVVRESEATTGGSGWKVTVKAGETIIDGSWIYDDLDKIDGLDLGHLAGNDRHYVVYQTYAYADSDPPATSVFAVSAGVAPPTQPTIPAGAVKLCDIFVPAAAASIGTVAGGNQQDPVQVSTTGVRFVQAPRLWPREDTGELMDRLIMSVGNTMLYTQGSISYDDGTGDLVFSQPVIVQSPCATHRQAFQNALGLTRTSMAAGTYSVPGTPGSRDVLIYLLVDRSSPNTGLSGTLKFLNRNSPGTSELSDLLDYTKRTQVVVLGAVVGSKLFMQGVNGQLPLADADARKFLRNAPSGSHTWNLLDDTLFKGSLHALTFNSGSTTIDAAAKAAIASDLRVVGQRVSMFDSATSSFVDAVWNGTDYVVMHGTYNPLTTADTITLDIAKHVVIKTTAASAKDVTVSSARSLNLQANSATGGVTISQVDTGALVQIQNDGDIVIAAATNRSLVAGSSGTGTATLSAANATASVTSAKTTGDAVSITASNAGGRVFVGSLGTIRVEGEGNVSMVSIAGNTTLGSDGGTVEVVGDLDVDITSVSAGINILAAAEIDIKTTGGDFFMEAVGGGSIYLTAPMVEINAALAFDKGTATPAPGTGLSLSATGKSYLAINPTGAGTAAYDNITGGQEGQVLWIRNAGGAGEDIKFTEIGNIRLDGNTTTAPNELSMTPGDIVMFLYDGALWRQCAPYASNALS